MQTREDIIKRVQEYQVLTNQTDVRTDIILLTIITMQLEELESRLTAIEINTMNAQGLLPDESSLAVPAGSATSATPDKAPK